MITHISNAYCSSTYLIIQYLMSINNLLLVVCFWHVPEEETGCVRTITGWKRQSDEVIDEKGEMDRFKVKSLCGHHDAFRAAWCDCNSTQVQVWIQVGVECVTGDVTLQAFFTRFPLLDRPLSFLMAPCEALLKLLQPAGSSLYACNTQNNSQNRHN